jgi:hypothetical protein
MAKAPVWIKRRICRIHFDCLHQTKFTKSSQSSQNQTSKTGSIHIHD